MVSAARQHAQLVKAMAEGWDDPEVIEALRQDKEDRAIRQAEAETEEYINKRRILG